MAIGVIGGAAGVALGYLGAELVTRLAPPLTASTGLGTGTATPGGAGGAGPAAAGPLSRALSGAAHTISVQLTAPITPGVVALAVVLAIAGGLIAGSFGGWRAARLRPAAALTRVA